MNTVNLQRIILLNNRDKYIKEWSSHAGNVITRLVQTVNSLNTNKRYMKEWSFNEGIKFQCCSIHSQCRKIDLEGELKLRMLDHNIISIKRQCTYFALIYIIKCICQDTWYTLCLEQLYYCTGARYSSLCTLVHMCSCLHCTLQLPGASLDSAYEADYVR